MCPNVEYFVVFSSLVSCQENVGQTNYGFANSYVKRIGDKRRNDGLHGLAIQWGAIGDVGVIAERMGGNDRQTVGTVPQKIKSFLGVLDSFLQSNQIILSCHVKDLNRNRYISGYSHAKF